MRNAAFGWPLPGGHLQVLETDSSFLPPKVSACSMAACFFKGQQRNLSHSNLLNII